MFANRTDAGRQLARELMRFQPDRPLILGLPRGGVVVCAEVAHGLACDLDVLLVKKLRAPGNPELAIGAICEEGRAFLNDEIVRMTGANEAYLAQERKERLAEMAGQKNRYRTVRPRMSPTGRVAVLVDDGLATGSTMIAAIQAVALVKPKKIVVAVPVSPPETLRTIESMDAVGEVICLDTPSWFAGVGQFYEDFEQVPDEAVIAILKPFAS